MRPLAFDVTPVAKAILAPLPPLPAEAAEERRETVARQPAQLPRHIAKATGWTSTLAHEQIHALATHALARHTEHGMKVVAVTSALAGEGKTTISLALAAKLAAAGRKVLVVDLDTYRGTLSVEAKLDELPGAIESSGPDAAAPFHVYATDCAGVHLMPRGRIEEQDGIPVLSPERVQRLATRALQAFDVVLIDCPPLLPVADTHVIGAVADNAILVIRANATPQPILTQAINEFGRDKFFAAVLNRAQPERIPYFREVYGYYRRGATKRGR
ncbi:MAG: CpsD/CapB family tyrosine-protein kinase [Planctomycetota bacterium]